MNYKEVIESIKKWFELHYGGIHIILPDGWLGRPYDNSYFIKDIKIDDDFFEIVFNDDFMIMKVSGQPVVETGKKEIETTGTVELSMELTDFKKLFVEYGCGRKTAKTYTDGSVYFIVSPGAY